MLQLIYASVLFLLVGVSASPLAKRDFGPQTVFSPPSNYNVPRTLYARSLLLADVSLPTHPSSSDSSKVWMWLTAI